MFPVFLPQLARRPFRGVTALAALIALLLQAALLVDLPVSPAGSLSDPVTLAAVAATGPTLNADAQRSPRIYSQAPAIARRTITAEPRLLGASLETPVSPRLLEPPAAGSFAPRAPPLPV